MSTYYKILPDNLICRDFQYQEGLNIDTNTIDEYECSYGLHFADKKHILDFCGYGTIIAEVEIPEAAIVYHFDDKSKADKIVLKNLRPLWSVETIEALIQEGVDIESYVNRMLCNSTKNGYFDIVEYLIEHGADIHASHDCALRWSSNYGHLDVVKYLVEHGADIHACDDDALCWASENGYLEVVKYLVEQGANIHACYDYALRNASKSGYFDVVKYLVEQGANIHADYNYAIRYAGTIRIKTYLESLM